MPITDQLPTDDGTPAVPPAPVARLSASPEPTSVTGSAAIRYALARLAEESGQTVPLLRRDAGALLALLVVVLLALGGCSGSTESRAGEAAAWVGGLFVVACAVAIIGARISTRDQ